MKKPKSGRYKAYVFLGYTAEGKEKRKYVYATNPHQLKERLLDMKIQQAMGQLVGEKIKLCDWSKKWIKNKLSLSERSRKMYRDNLDRYIIPKLGELMLTDIRPFHVQDLMNDLYDRPRTAQIVLMILDQMFRYAVSSEMMVKNPAKQATKPISRSAPKRRTTLAEERAILDADFTDMERVYVYLCRHAGLRKSEARGVMISDVGDRLTVNRSVTALGGVLPYGKTERAYRTIPMRKTLKDVLGAYKTKGLYLIHNCRSTPMTDNQYNRFWAKIKYKMNKAIGGTGHISKAGQYVIDLYAVGRDLSAHILRHTYATELAEKGYTPAEIQYLMGHSTARLAQEVYTHIDTSKITAIRLDADPVATPMTP